MRLQFPGHVAFCLRSRGNHGATAEAWIHLLGPASGEAIPGHVQQEAFAQAVITRDQVQARRQGR